MNKLQEQKWQVAREYARQFAVLMGADEWHFVDYYEKNQGQPDVLNVDGVIVLGMTDVMMVIDRLPEWVERYGAREAVRDEVLSWQVWWLDTLAVALPNLQLMEDYQHRIVRTVPGITLQQWLSGCPRGGERTPAMTG